MRRREPVGGLGAPAIAAATWCALFATVHVFWGLGGSVGLASSVGRRLADSRPEGFVVFGLYGVAVLLVVGIFLIMVLTGVIGSRRQSRFASLVAMVAGAGLLIRAIVVEVILLSGVGGVRATIGPLETRWSLALWNPWFALGGALFVWAGLRARRRNDPDAKSS